MSGDELFAELRAITGAIRARIEVLHGRGVLGIPVGPTPRYGVQAPAESASTPAPGFGPGDRPSAPAPASGVRPPASGSGSGSGSGDRPPVAQGQTAPDAATELESLHAQLASCQACRLASGRKNVVFGVGNPAADLMFIGEAPGRDEDEQGEPFVGAAGQLLTRMIQAMGLARDEVYIANIIKCRPPQNRDPSPDEMDICEPFLRQQIALIQPRIIIALGNFAAKRLLRTETGITRLRGRFFAYESVPVMPTFHPAFLLRNPQAKRPVWEDLKQVMAEMDKLGLQRRRG